jgi:hypothetical protein
MAVSKIKNMPDIDNNVAADSQLDQAPNSETSGTTTDQQDAGDVAPSTDVQDNLPPADDNEEPITRERLSKRDYIIGRQKAKLAKEQAKATEIRDEDIDYDNVTPEDEALISKVVAKRFAPIIEKSLAAEDDMEINQFLTENPDFKEFEAKARRYMQHESRRHLPIKSIFYEIAGDKLMKIGAERAKQADQRAKESQVGGGSTRTDIGKPDVWSLTPEQFKAEQDALRKNL